MEMQNLMICDSWFLSPNVYDGMKWAFTFYVFSLHFIVLPSSLWNFMILDLVLLAIQFFQNYSENKSCFSIFVIVVESFLLKTISFFLKFSDMIAYLTKNPT